MSISETTGETMFKKVPRTETNSETGKPSLDQENDENRSFTTAETRSFDSKHANGEWNIFSQSPTDNRASVFHMRKRQKEKNSNRSEDTPQEYGSISSSVTIGFAKDSVDTVRRKSAEQQRGDLEHTPLFEEEVKKSDSGSEFATSPKPPVPLVEPSSRRSAAVNSEVTLPKSDKNHIEMLQDPRLSRVSGELSMRFSGDSKRSGGEGVHHAPHSDEAGGKDSRKYVEIIRKTETNIKTQDQDDIYAKGDSGVDTEPTEISEFRKQMYRDFPAKEKSETAPVVTAPDIAPTPSATNVHLERRKSKIQLTSVRKQRSPLLSITSTLPHHAQENVVESSKLLDQILPEGVRKLLGKLQQPGDLAGLAAYVDTLEREGRLLSALRLLEPQEPSPSQPWQKARVAKTPVRRKQIYTQPSFRMPPSQPPDLDRAQRILRQALQAGLSGATYSSKWAPHACRVLAAFITQEIKALELPRYKIGCLVRLVERRHQRMCTHVAVLWDPECDRFCESHYEENTWLAQAILFVIHLD